jgi:pimeloyl-ACP methyl ester carboxylesterase
MASGARIEEQWTKVSGHTIFSRCAAQDAPPNARDVVLVHGYVASSDYMVPTMRALSPHVRVHAPDLPGWGKSDKSCHGTTLAGLADVLAAWMEARGIGRAALLGNSLGCQIVAELATRRPESLSCAVLLGPTVDPAARTTAQQAWRLMVDIPRERPSLWPVELLDLWKMGARCALQMLQEMMDDRIEEKLPRIHAPVLVLRGGRDPICPQSWAERAAGLLANGELEVLAGAGHAANYSAPQEVAGAVLRFLHRLPPDGSA